MTDIISLVAGVSSTIAVITSLIPLLSRYVYGHLASQRLAKTQMEVRVAEHKNAMEHLTLSVKAEGVLERDEELRRAIEHLQQMLEMLDHIRGSIQIRIVDPEGAERSSSLSLAPIAGEGGQQQ